MVESPAFGGGGELFDGWALYGCSLVVCHKSTGRRVRNNASVELLLNPKSWRAPKSVSDLLALLAKRVRFKSGTQFILKIIDNNGRVVHGRTSLDFLEKNGRNCVLAEDAKAFYLKNQERLKEIFLHRTWFSRAERSFWDDEKEAEFQYNLTRALLFHSQNKIGKRKLRKIISDNDFPNSR